MKRARSAFEIFIERGPRPPTDGGAGRQKRFRFEIRAARYYHRKAAATHEGLFGRLSQFTLISVYSISGLWDSMYRYQILTCITTKDSDIFVY